MILFAKVNGSRLHGLPHREIVSALGTLPQHVCMVVARQTDPVSVSAVDLKTTPAARAQTPQLATPLLDRLVKAKSEQMLSSSDMSSLAPNKSMSKSLDSLSLFGMWSSDLTEVELIKGDSGLGFSILDYPVVEHVILLNDNNLAGCRFFL